MHKIDDHLLTTIQSIDMDFLTKQIQKKLDWSDQRIKNALIRYRQYLYITAVQEKPIIPTKDVDDVWHQHILNTKLYSRHCDMIYGKMLHHQPFDSEESKKESDALKLPDIAKEYFKEDYPEPSDEQISVECCSDDSECCSSFRTIKVE